MPKDRVAGLIGWLREEKHLLNLIEGRNLLGKSAKLIENTPWYEIVFPTPILTDKEMQFKKTINKAHEEELQRFEANIDGIEYVFNEVLPNMDFNSITPKH